MVDEGHAVEPMLELTEVEQKLWHAFRAGKELILGRFDPRERNSLSIDQWGSDRQIRAEALASLMLHGPDAKPGSPVRLRLTGARIVGKLDVGCGRVAPFTFHECLFDFAPFLNDSDLSFVGFTSCFMPGLSAARINNTGPIWLDGTRLVGPLDLEDSDIKGDVTAVGASIECKNANALDLRGTQIGGDLSFLDAEITCSNARAIYGRQVAVEGSVHLGGDFRCDGMIYLEGSRIKGKLILDDAKISNPKKTALQLDHAVIGLGIHASDMRCEGGIRLHHARVGCQVCFSRSQILNPNGKAISADHLIVEGSVLMNGGFIAEGPVDLHGANIECTLNLYAAKLSANDEMALTGDGMQVGKDIRARKAIIEGGARLAAVKVGGSLLLEEAEFRKPGKVAFDVSQSIISGDVIATRNFRVDGGFSLADAAVGVSLQLSDAHLSNPDGSAIAAAGTSIKGDLIGDRVEVSGLVDLASADIAGNMRFADANLGGVPAKQSSIGLPLDQRRGHDWRGVSLRCIATEVGGDIDLRGTRLGECLNLKMARVANSVLLDGARLEAEDPPAVVADGLIAQALLLRLKTSPKSGIQLTSVRLESLADGPTSWPELAPLSIEGLTYARLETSLSLGDRILWLKRATPTYSPQPYEQLASCLLANGQDTESRRVRLEALRRSYESRGVSGRAWGRIQDWVIGFGYAPIRAALIFVLLWAAAALWFSYGGVSCHRSDVNVAGLCPINASNHPSWDPWLYSLDLLLPIVDLGQAKAWDPTGVTKIVMCILVAFGWILTTTIVAAATRALKRP